MMKKSKLKEIIKEIIKQEMIISESLKAKEIVSLVWGDIKDNPESIFKKYGKKLFKALVYGEIENPMNSTKDVVSKLKTAGYSDSEIHQIRDAVVKSLYYAHKKIRNTHDLDKEILGWFDTNLKTNKDIFSVYYIKHQYTPSVDKLISDNFYQSIEDFISELFKEAKRTFTYKVQQMDFVD